MLSGREVMELLAVAELGEAMAVRLEETTRADLEACAAIGMLGGGEMQSDAERENKPIREANEFAVEQWRRVFPKGGAEWNGQPPGGEKNAWAGGEPIAALVRQEGWREGVEDAAREVEGHWNDAEATINQKYQATRSAGVLRQMAERGSEKITRAPAEEEGRRLIASITDYLATGGLWNPEMMEPEKVRDLLIECREHITKMKGTSA